MATGTRIRQDFIEGTLVSNLSTSATAMESDGLADLTVIDNATNNEYAALVIGDEVVHVITHNSAATTAEIQRGQEGKAAAAHDAGAPWHHGPTEDDFTELKVLSAKANLSGAAQSISNNTLTPVVFDTEVWDDDGMWAAASGDRLTAQTAGKILAVGGVLWDVNDTGRRDVFIRKNGVDIIASDYRVAATNSGVTVSVQDVAVVGDYYELLVRQTSGAALNVLANVRTSLSLTVGLGS